MEAAQGNTLQSLRNVHAFLTEQARSLPGVVHTGARRKLAALLADLTELVAEQEGSDLTAQGETRTQRALRRSLLRDHMIPIARIARSELSAEPALEPFRLPLGRPTGQRLAAGAHGMAEAAAPLADVFVGAGLSEAFVDDLHAAADALIRSLDRRAQYRGRRSGATAGLRTTLSAGRKLVHVLDAFVQRTVVNDPALLANWNTVKRVQRLPGRRSAGPATTIPGAVAMEEAHVGVALHSTASEGVADVADARPIAEAPPRLSLLRRAGIRLAGARAPMAGVG